MNKTIFEEAVDVFGKDHQLGVTVEEMGECVAEITRFQTRGRGTEDDVIHEIADVCIMMQQCHYIYGDRLIRAIEKKSEKLRGHLDDRRNRDS